MGSSGDPSVFGTIFCFIALVPWVIWFWLVLTGRPKRRQEQEPYREIPTRYIADERAGFVQAKLEKIERASR